MTRICMTCIDRLFDGRDYFYFITIKPPPSEINHRALYNVLDYMKKKRLVFWLVKCQSNNGYIHYHGIVSFNESQTPHKGVLSLLQRQINRVMGFVQINVLQTSMHSVYRYIRDERNSKGGTFEQSDFISPFITGHRCVP